MSICAPGGSYTIAGGSGGRMVDSALNGSCSAAGGSGTAGRGGRVNEHVVVHDHRGAEVGAQGAQLAQGKEPPHEEMVQWLADAGVRDLVPDASVRRAYLSFSRCPFGSQVTEQQQRRFFRRLAPHVDHLAVDPTDLGCFTDPAHVHHIELADTTPIDQPPYRGTPEVERWLKEEWVPQQEGIGLIRKADPYEVLPVVTSLLTVPGTQSGQPYRVV